MNNCVIKSNSILCGGFIGNFDSSYIIFNDACICENNMIYGLGYIGGFVGHIASSSTLTISENASQGDGCKVINCYIYAKKYDVGGFVGCRGKSSSLCKIDGVIINKCSIARDNTTDSSYVGGIVGNGGTTSDTVITNPIIKNCTIKGEKDNVSGVIGGYS